MNTEIVSATREKIVAIVAQHLSIEKSSIGADATLDTLGMDSLDRVEVVMKIEEEFDVEINDEEADKLCSLTELANYVDSLKK
jgi:acyl carrier protein